MYREPEKLAGTTIESREAVDDWTLTWPWRHSPWDRLGEAALMALALCFWAVGEYYTLTRLSEAGPVGEKVVLVAWLVGWTLGGLVWLGWFCSVIISPRPESITLGSDGFRYGSAIEMTRNELTGFVLERVAGRQCLYFECGPGRVEIGMHLREPEREWLHAALEHWRVGARSAPAVGSEMADAVDVSLPDKLAESAIVQDDNDEECRLHWVRPTPPEDVMLGVYLVSVSLCLCAWVASGIIQPPPWHNLRSALVLAGILAVWTIAALGAMWLFHKSFPKRPESVILGKESLRYDPGSLPFTSKPVERHDPRPPPFKNEPVEIARSELGPFVVERIGDRQRLRFDYRADRIEIGACLSKPDREWLHALLECWRRRR